jgi:3-hydroxyacyl-CoA dehydrogenase/enoyl-CoA hydratase/carnithine racemase
MTIQDTSIDLTAFYPKEVVTQTLVRDITLPGGAGTMALVTIDNGFDHTRPTTFGPAGVAGMRAAFEALAKRAEAGEIQAVGVTGKPFIFAVGFDLSGAPNMSKREEGEAMARLGHDTYKVLMDLPVPTFGFVNGAVMGGGLELALACDYRSISAGVPMLAFPECFLGLAPVWGGCWMTPNLVGVAGALTLIVDNAMNNNKMIKGPAAFEMGLADVMFEPADFLEESLAWAAKVVTGETKVTRPEIDRDEATWEGAIAKARKGLDARTGRQAPAPYRALDLISKARTATRDEGFAAEDEVAAELLMMDETRAGLYAFDLVQKRAKRPAGAPDKKLARPITKIGIVGAGLMASQLALLFIQRLQVPVILTDLDQERVDKGVGWVHDQLGGMAAKGRLNGDKYNRFMALVSGSTSKDGFADADFVIEAVFEEMSVKKTVFAECEAVVGPECILASNTSSLSITEMASGLQHPERVVGFHFFNPVSVMPLLEVIPGQQTDDATLATAFATGRSLGKTCILAGDAPSFVANRLLGRLMSDAFKILDEGTPVAVVDQAFAGIAPMPLYVLLGLVGPAIALHNSETLKNAFPDRFYVSENLRRVVQAGKSGYYIYPEGKPQMDPEVEALLETPENPVVLDAAQVREQVLGGLADEVRRMLDDKVAQAPMDADLAMITGAGFFFWNGGLTPLLDRSGASQARAGGRFLPPGVASVPA